MKRWLWLLRISYRKYPCLCVHRSAKCVNWFEPCGSSCKRIAYSVNLKQRVKARSAYILHVLWESHFSFQQSSDENSWSTSRHRITLCSKWMQRLRCPKHGPLRRYFRSVDGPGTYVWVSSSYWRAATPNKERTRSKSAVYRIGGLKWNLERGQVWPWISQNVWNQISLPECVRREVKTATTAAANPTTPNDLSRRFNRMPW